MVIELQERINVITTALSAAAAKSLQSCPTLSDLMDCSLPGSSVHGIFQATVLEWGAIAFSRGLICPGAKKNPFQFPEGKHTVVSRNPVLLEPEKSRTFLIHPLCSKGTLFLDC